MNYKKLIGFGVMIWAVAFLVMAGLIAYQLGNSIIAAVITWIAVAVAAYLCGRNLALNSKAQMLKYSVSWVIIGLILDALFTVPFTGWTIFQSWEVWIGYVLVIAAPLLAVKNQPLSYPQTQ